MADPDPMTCDPGSRVYDPDPGTVIPDPIYLGYDPALSLRRHFAGKPVKVSQNVRCFLRLKTLV